MTSCMPTTWIDVVMFWSVIVGVLGFACGLLGFLWWLSGRP